MVVAFVDDHRGKRGVEPICEAPSVAPSTYYRRNTLQVDPSLRSARARRGEALKPEIRRAWRENFEAYGAEKVWRQLNREGTPVARWIVERLMQEEGFQCVTRGRRFRRTTEPDEAAPHPLDLVDRDFSAERPNELWVSDLTYVAT